VVSVIAHVLLIGAAVGETRRPVNLEPDWIENRAYYLPPPNRAPSQQSSRETIKYIELTPEGPGSGVGRGGADDAPLIEEVSSELGDIGRNLTSSIEAPRLLGGDSVFTQLEVDSTVSRFPGSAAPSYPAELLKHGIQGSVVTQYVVDTTGYADSTSLRIIRSTDSAFANAVRAAIPYMRFFPAKVGSKRVRQLVEQEFSFKIDPKAGL
jgi:protein TonB